MSGGRDFDPDRFLGVASYMVDRGGLMHPGKLAFLMFNADFDAYRLHGQSLTGATWLRGEEFPEVREAGPDWFRRFIKAQIPWWARIGGWLLTGYAVIRMFWPKVAA